VISSQGGGGALRQCRVQAVPRTGVRARASSLAALAVVVALGCLLALTASAAAANGEEPPPPTTLWEHFPLNPTGERLREGSSVRGALRPPTAPVATAPRPPESGTAPIVFAIVAAVATFVLVLAVFSAGARFRAGRHRRIGTGGERRPSAYVSAFLVGSRWLPVVDEIAGAETRPPPVRARAAVGLAGALAVLVALLVFRYG
jgi:hypothetical protein